MRIVLGVATALALFGSWQAASAATAHAVQLVAGPAPTLAIAAPVVAAPPHGAHGFPFGTTNLDLAAVGYVEQEFLFSGQARGFAPNGNLGTDGRWQVAPAPGKVAPFTTRLIVRRPADPSRFNGTVVVEWLNVTAGYDLAPDWYYGHEELVRDGYAWVGVSAQYDGVAALKRWDGAAGGRYASLSHPGDSYSYDIFNQAGAALRAAPGATAPLGTLSGKVTRLIATGESQAALRLMTYANAVQRLAQVYDGLIIHSGVLGEELSQADVDHSGTAPARGIPLMTDVVPPLTSVVRTDLPQPILFVNTETDVGALGAAFTVHGEADGPGFRLWELAGTAHMDTYAVTQAVAEMARTGLAPKPTCAGTAANTGPGTYGYRSAIVAMDHWVRTGIAPRSQPRLQSWGPVFGMFGLNRDANGNVLGGIRLPQEAVPVATETGVRANPGSAACMLIGASDAWGATSHTSPITGGATPTLASLYPNHAAYVTKVTNAANASVSAGVLLPADAAAIEAAAAASNVP